MATRKVVQLGVVLAALLGMGASGVAAAVIPYGVANDVSYDTVVNDWGWTVAYRGNYADMATLADVFANAKGEYIMLAAIRDGSATFDVLAAARKSDVFTYTTRNATHEANGAEWYFNGYSMGFAGLGDTIYQNSADTIAQSDRDRLSWHTATTASSRYSYQQDWSQVPQWLLFGWRSGSNVNLNNSTDWDRVVLVADAESVPEPSSALLGGIGLVGLAVVGAMRRRNG